MQTVQVCVCCKPYAVRQHGVLYLLAGRSERPAALKRKEVIESEKQMTHSTSGIGKHGDARAGGVSCSVLLDNIILSHIAYAELCFFMFFYDFPKIALSLELFRHFTVLTTSEEWHRKA